jgi:hypothetical protein
MMPFWYEQVKLLVIVIVWEQACESGNGRGRENAPRPRTWPTVRPVFGVTVVKPCRPASKQYWPNAEPKIARRVVVRRVACMTVELERGYVGAWCSRESFAGFYTHTVTAHAVRDPRDSGEGWPCTSIDRVIDAKD